MITKYKSIIFIIAILLLNNSCVVPADDDGNSGKDSSVSDSESVDSNTSDDDDDSQNNSDSGIDNDSGKHNDDEFHFCFYRSLNECEEDGQCKIVEAHAVDFENECDYLSPIGCHVLSPASIDSTFYVTDQNGDCWILTGAATSLDSFLERERNYSSSNNDKCNEETVGSFPPCNPSDG